ncbi:amidase [Tateyamaria omphalii]|uniref:Amidase n=1 Tax=Tateyamaria omphalii TaxID=299262 RepID=A0A1P8MTD5_9RHOB|nr:amidase [Tateyamaria omphalii]APX11253.1 amidase [Tateyamaria omphalii]
MIEQGALALRARMDAGEMSASDLMAETLTRIDAVNPAVNAIVSLRDPDTLMAEARAADAAPNTGWLHGIPMAIKDLANAAGLPTSMGSPLFAGQVAASDDIMVARLRAAGAIIIGKTNTPEFGLGSHSINPVFGPTRNPYDTSRSAGGSSGGAGVALATSMLSVADGSDMMGSLRNPAGWNNVYGMRPSWGLVPSEPQGDSFLHQLSTNGPMARTPADLAALLDTMAGADPRQPHGVDAPPTLPQISGGADGMRIGWLGDWGGALTMEEGILDLCADALAQMETLGVTTDALNAPFDRDALWHSWITLRSWAVAGGLGVLHADPTKRTHLKDTAIWEVERGLALSAMEVHRASVTRSEWFKTAATLFEQFDVLALPSAQMWPFDVTLDWPRSIAGQAMDTYHRWMEVVIPASLLGLPAICVPAGFGGPHDLPMGLQLIGRRGSDAMLLRLAQTWHDATNWPARRPPSGM